MVSSSSSEPTSARSLLERWRLVGKDTQEAGEQTSESSERGEVLAEQGEVGLS